MATHSNKLILHRSGECERLGNLQPNEGVDWCSNDRSQEHPCEDPSIVVKHFPPEIWSEIAFHSACLATRYEPKSPASYNAAKPKTNLLRHLGSVSKFHRQLVLRHWAYAMHLVERFDSEKLGNLGVANGIDLMNCVRCLVCKNEYDIYRAPEYTFEAFGFLEELVLNCHRDINFEVGVDQQQNPHIYAEPPAVGAHIDQPTTQGNPAGHAHQPPTRMSYRRLRVNLPSTLHTLRVYDSHVPDIYFIQQVAEQCPSLKSLTLARCTLFTRQRCEFWRRLPRAESDAYFSDQGVSAYSSAIGRELKHIKNLQELEIGIYLTSHAAIDTHLEQHAALGRLSEASLDVWGNPCNQCVAQYQEPTVAMEIEATGILAREVPTLHTVSWASFCSEKRIGWSTHRIVRGERGEFQEVRQPVS